MGTNEWAIKRGKNAAFLEQKIDYFQHRIRTVVANSSAKFSFVVVPEKDMVMDKTAKRHHLYQYMDTALNKLSATCQEVGRGFVYDGFLENYPRWVSEDEYAYPDSHLLSRDYLSVAGDILRAFK